MAHKTLTDRKVQALKAAPKGKLTGLNADCHANLQAGISGKYIT